MDLFEQKWKQHLTELEDYEDRYLEVFNNANYTINQDLYDKVIELAKNSIDTFLSENKDEIELYIKK